MNGRRWVGLGLAFLLSGCAASAPVGGPEPAGEAANPDPEKLPDGTPLLQVKITDQTTDGHVMLMRGKLVNNHPETAQGVRLLLLMGTPKGDGSFRIMDIQRKEMTSTTLQPGKSTMFRWDVESQSNRGPFVFRLFAIPVHLGEREIPPPAEWTSDPPPAS